MVECTSAPTTTSISGAPTRPFASTSHPAASRTAWRAAARQVKCAIWQPETRPKLASAGRPSRSMSHAPTASSTTDAAGPAEYSPAFWSHVEVSQSAATAAGTLPPMT